MIGLGIALAIAPHLQRHASPGELPGAMQARGLDPSGPILQFGFIVVLTFLAPMVVTGFSPSARGLKPAATKDVVLIAAWFPLYFGLLDVLKTDARWLALIATGVIAALRFVVPARSFALAPLAIVSHGLFAIAWVIATPLLLRRIDVRRAIPWVFAVFSFAYPLAILGVTNTPYLDFFEDGHELVVANEIAHGERPYADIVPVHGLVSDGGLDALAGDHSAARILRVRRFVSALNLVAIYTIAVAASGSAELGLLAVFLAVTLVPAATIWLRTIPALFALASTCAAIRLRSRRWIVVAGVLVVIAFLFGTDFGVYSGVVALVVALRMRAVRALLAGLAAATVVVAILFAIGHFAWPFVHTLLFELLPAGRVYVPGPLQFPPERVIFAIWIMALVFAAATLRNRIGRSEAMWAVALWAVVAGLSYAQRRHEYAAFVLPPFLVIATWLIARRWRFAAVLAGVAILIAANPFNHIFNVATPLRRQGGVQPGGNSIVSGVVVPPDVARGIDSARRFVATLPPDATWFDFSNSPSLYFLLSRSCPTRQHQVPFYETEQEQREVIAALERDHSVRAALIACPGGDNAIDGVPNRVRAPLVWRYLQSHFTPAHDADGVVFWTRR